MAADPYRYFLPEARELTDALSVGVLEVERGGGSDAVARVLRLAHTLKGAARVVRQAPIGDLAHALEDALAPFRTGGTPAREQVEAMLAAIDAINGRLAALEAERARPAAPPTPAATREAVRPSEIAPAHAEPAPRLGEPAPRPGPSTPGGAELETVRVDSAALDDVLADLTEASAQLAGLEAALGELDDARGLARHLTRVLEAHGDPRVAAAAGEIRQVLDRLAPRLLGGAERASREVGQARERATDLRLAPAGTIFVPLERAARDAAAASGRTVRFVANGGDTRIAGALLPVVRDALLHLVRNAVGHGIEPPDARLAAHKPPEGLVTVSVERRGGNVVFSVADDGRGIDVAGVRAAAVRRGALAADATIGESDVLRLVLQPGLTTAHDVTQIAGRGVGLDVVREVAARLRGEVEVSSVPGKGALFRICVPMRVAAVSLLLAEVDGEAVGLPIEGVERTVRITRDAVRRDGDRTVALLGDSAFPFAHLAGLLHGDERASVETASGTSAAILRAGGDRVAVAVDQFLGIVEVVLRPLPALAGANPLLAGAYLDGEGLPRLVLSSAGVVAAARAAAVRAGGPSSEQRPRLPILVVDDSLTTRMLEQSILEAAGYEVDVAASGEEGLELARRRRYAVYVVDVEMPGMNGYEFVSHTRSDEALAQAPAVLVTSLSSPEHRRRGAEAGARAWIVKGEFEEANLLRTIRDLIG